MNEEEENKSNDKINIQTIEEIQEKFESKNTDNKSIIENNTLYKNLKEE